MDLDRLKEIWDQENVADTPEISLEKQKEIHLPLEKIRKNMRMEFWTTVATFIFIFLFFALVELPEFKFKVYVMTLVATMLMITSFYFFKFFNLYKNLSNNNLNTLDALKDLKHQFKLNEQYYLAFYIAFAPFVVCEMLLVFEFSPSLKMLMGTQFILIFLSSCLVILGSLYIFGKFWFNKLYSKHFKQINAIIDNLK